MVNAMSDDWVAECAESGEQALRMMERQSFDLVVSDMRMPGMTGTQLLNEVLKRYPATGRIIVSGYSDQADVLRCIGATHQFLAKPFNMPVLHALLNRFRGLRQGLQSEEIQKLITRKRSLPSIPAIYLQLLEALQDPDCSTDRIGEIVATDAALTARILQLVNSAFFGFAREVSSATEAVMLLGTGTIRSLVLATELFSSFQAIESGAWSSQRLWWHNMRVGQWARRIAQYEGGDETLAEQAFTAGVLHDVGKLILMDQLAETYVELWTRAGKERRKVSELEQESFGATHAEVGACLLDLWGLPAPLVEAVALHHQPSRGAENEMSPLTAVHVANVLDNAHAAGPTAALNGLDEPYLERLNLTGRVEAWRSDLAAQSGR
jgi:HD-like signal output (HDOD) protein